tara:strand:+ start:19486 stop:22002 length:2517 start_codon:yes stop_codon:yes gene_type:complete
MISKYNKNILERIHFSNRSKNIFIILVIFIFGFILGVVGIRYDYIKNAYYALQDVPSLINNISYSINRQVANFEKVSIDMKFEEYQKIVKKREENIKNGHAVYGGGDWAKGSIGFTSNNEKYKGKFRLKGTMSDNWSEDDGRWSFRVNLKGKNRYEGMKEFSLFKPSLGSGVLEWLFQNIAKKEGIISLKTKVVKLYLNGQNLGFYYLQEHYNKSLIERTKRREGPIVGYKKDRIVKLWHSDPTVALKTNGFMVSDVSISGKYSKLKKKQKEMVGYAINALENLRNRKEKPSKILDTDLMAKLLAIRAIIGSNELDWKDIKFYYNPLTSKLEPIPREAHVGHDLHDWWYRGTRELNAIKSDEYTTYQDIIFADLEIYDRYMFYLRNYIDSNIFNSVINSNKSEYTKYISAMALTNDGAKWIEYLRARGRKISAALYHPDPISVHFLDEKHLSIRNLQFFPIVLRNILVNGEKIYKEDVNKNIQGRINNEEYFDSIVSIGSRKVSSNDVIEVLYSVYGSKERKYSEVRMYAPIEERSFNKDLYKDYFYIKDGVLTNKNKTTIIQESVFTPKNTTVIISSGSQIIFQSKGQLIVQGNLILDGTKNKRISITSSKGAEKGGILVINAHEKSLIRHTHFNNLAGVFLDNKVISGSVNFYKSDVDISDSIFSDNKIKDDYINIISSNFNIKNIKIINSYADSIDIDFSEGQLNNISIINSGNDGIDLSGSPVTMKNINISKSNDKAISVGEESVVTAAEVNIDNSFIGIATKDGSQFISNDVTIANNQYDYVSFVKKEEYGGPSLIVDKNNGDFDYILGNNSKIIIDGKVLSKITKNIQKILY